MKHIVFLSLLFLGTTLSAQNKNTKVSIEVDGVCMMCKTRIEKASIKTNGVKYANWNVNSHELKLIFDDQKTSLKEIKQNIIAVGHDTKGMKAKDEIYNSNDACCKYRDEKVLKDHRNN